jgi:multiple sugar transport system permease protein
METNVSNRTKNWLALAAVPIILWTAIPLVWILAESLKSTAALGDPSQNVFGNFWPKDMTWENYQLIFTGGAKDLFLPALWHSIVVCAIATVISVVLATFCAYAIARLNFPGKKLILTTALGVSFFPVIAMVTPLFNLWRQIGLFDTIPGLVIPYLALTLPLSIWTLSAFFQQIPWEMEQAAQVDGATTWQAFRKVIVPLAAPGVFTTTIIAFFTGASQFVQPTGAICAAAVVVTIPVVILVLIFQRRIVAGLTSGAVKG